MTSPTNQDTPVAFIVPEALDELRKHPDASATVWSGKARHHFVQTATPLYSSDHLDRMRERAERAEAERADEWRARREAEASRDTALAVAATFRAERDELRAAAIKAQAVLAMFVAPDAIKQTTVINAYAAAVEAETALRTLLTKLQEATHGHD